jgi:hypothetical protein
MFRDLLTPEEREKLDRENAHREKNVKKVREMGTRDFLVLIIHSLHNCGPVMGGARTHTEKVLTRYQNEAGEGWEDNTVQVFAGQTTWDKHDPVYDAQMRYLYLPELIVRMWCLSEVLKDYEGTGEYARKVASGFRPAFPTKCPLVGCTADIRHLFEEFTR